MEILYFHFTATHFYRRDRTLHIISRQRTQQGSSLLCTNDDVYVFCEKKNVFYIYFFLIKHKKKKSDREMQRTSIDVEDIMYNLLVIFEYNNYASSIYCDHEMEKPTRKRVTTTKKRGEKCECHSTMSIIMPVLKLIYIPRKNSTHRIHLLWRFFFFF